MKTLRVIISRTVQGLLFRRFIEENANRIGVRGLSGTLKMEELKLSWRE